LRAFQSCQRNFSLGRLNEFTLKDDIR
jgi:hypothetical protein